LRVVDGETDCAPAGAPAFPSGIAQCSGKVTANPKKTYDKAHEHNVRVALETRLTVIKGRSTTAASCAWLRAGPHTGEKWRSGWWARRGGVSPKFCSKREWLKATLKGLFWVARRRGKAHRGRAARAKAGENARQRSQRGHLSLLSKIV
jgi:hypothetical protein